MVESSRKPPSLPVNCQECPVRGLTLCQPLSGDALDIVQTFKWGDRVLPAGSQLFMPADTCSELFNLLDGWIALYRVLNGGQNQILDFALPGSFLGYQPDLQAPMLHGAECLTDVSVCVFPRRQFISLIQKHPSLAIRLADMNAHRAIIAHDHLTNVGLRTARTRIVHLLRELCSRMGHHQKISSGQTIEIPLSQRHIGDALGLTNVHVSQTLSGLREKGLLRFKKGRLEIFDPDRLFKAADQDELLAV